MFASEQEQESKQEAAVNDSHCCQAQPLECLPETIELKGCHCRVRRESAKANTCQNAAGAPRDERQRDTARTRPAIPICQVGRPAAW